MKQAVKTRKFKLYFYEIEIDKEVKPIRMCNRKCTIVGDKVYSYDTHVATIDWATKTLFVPERSYRYSSTTNRQLSRVASELNLMVFGDRPRVKRVDFTHGW